MQRGQQDSSARPKARPLSPTWPWDVVWPSVGALLTVLLFLVYAFYTQYRAQRGYTPLGLFLGFSALALILFATAYSLRRRLAQEYLPGSLANWLWAHVVLGALTLIMGLLHGGFWPRISLGWLALLLLAMVILSGLIGRLLYAILPPAIVQRVGNLIVHDTQQELSQLAFQIDQQLAGRSDELKQRTGQLIAAQASHAHWEQAMGGLGKEEAEALDRIATLALRQQALQGRLQQQERYRWLLKVWRRVHLPATVALLVAIGLHVVAVTDPFRSAGEADDFVPTLNDTFGLADIDMTHAESHDSRTCGSCHVQQYNEWLGSMHSYAQATTTTEWQTILYDLESQALFPGQTEVQGQFCTRCHTPIGTRLFVAGDAAESPQATFLERAPISQEGVQCVSCHLPTELPEAAHRDVGVFAYGLEPSQAYVGTFGAGTPEDPALVGNPYHRGGPSVPFSNPFESTDSFHEAAAFCSRCHNVSYPDQNTGVLFELQKSYTEWLLNSVTPAELAVLPTSTCQDCHMSVQPGVPNEFNPDLAGEPMPLTHQVAAGSFDSPLPAREMATHTFVGVDHPRATDPSLNYYDPGTESTPPATFQARETLLKNTLQPPYAAEGQLGLQVEAPPSATAGRPLSFSVSLSNLGAGHNFPTGFAFARQGWLAITVTDSLGNVLLLSGELDAAGDLVETRCNRPTQQIVTQDVDTLRAGGAAAVQLAREKLGLAPEEVADGPLEAGGLDAVRAVLLAQRARNETAISVDVDARGRTVVNEARGGVDGDGTHPPLAGTPCVVNLQTQLFTLLPPDSEPLSAESTALDNGTILAGERDAYIQTRVLRRFVAACETDPTSEECLKGPAQAFAIIAGQRITLLFESLPLPTEASEVSIEVDFLFRNYPPYFLRALARDMAQVAAQPDGPALLDAAEIEAAGETLVAELLAQRVTVASARLRVPVR